MLKHLRVLFSATLVAVLVVSTLVLSSPVRVRACDDGPPASLLSLYLTSDLIVVGEIRREKDGEILDDSDDYVFLEVSRQIRVLSTLKGKSPSNLVFIQSEWREKSPPAEAPNEEGNEYHGYGYKGDSKLISGERYLFFFRTMEDAGTFELTNSITGARRLSDDELGIYQKRIKELRSIVKKKKSEQAAALVEWLIRCVEEPATRWDGIIALNQSFEMAEAPTDVEESNADLVLNEEFTPYTPVLARNLTDAQKERLSSLLFGSFHETVVEQHPYSFYYSLSDLVRRWDKPRLAMYAFSMMQVVDAADESKVSAMMHYIASVLRDEELIQIASRHWESLSPAPVDKEIEESEPSDLPDQDEENTGGEVIKVVEKKAEEKGEVKETDAAQPEADETEPGKEELTPEQLRAKLLEDFIKRYEYLLVRGFEVERVSEVAEK